VSGDPRPRLDAPESSARLAVAFARVARAFGVEVPVASVVLLGRALGAVGLARPERVYWAGRATLVHDPGEVEAYGRAFVAFWASRRPPLAEPVTVPVAVETDDGEDAWSKPPTAALGPRLTVRYSPAEILAGRDFAACTHDELAEAHRLMQRFRWHGEWRRSSRLVPAGERRGRPDLRRTLRRALRSGGEPVRQLRRRPGEKPRRVVFICDISGSMDPYARALLRFVHTAVASRSRVEAFVLGTRLTRVTRQLESKDPDAALARAASSVEDWSGGTRLGEGIATFNAGWGLRGMARAAIVVVLSDGWDRGDPKVLAEEMERLSRVARRIIWVNPLKASPGYEPLARGMAAALPHVDEFVEGHSLASLEHLAEVIAR
jgi:uncharacterized protein